MEKQNSNENQTATVFRFGAFELHPQDRLLKRDGEDIPLAPKAFDTLLYLVRRAGRLVTKTELMETLWPATYVSEASLTNLIVGLRKALGREAIRTVSKWGYRLELPVKGEPGISRNVYDLFVRAKDLTTELSVETARQACELYWTCLAEDPGFAPAWAWLGRTAYRLSKFTERKESNLALADAAFRRAFAIDPDLAAAHQFYTPVETDMGLASRAMRRLVERTARHCEPGDFAGLVQVFRYCGLLTESMEAHEQAVEMDPTIATSVPHTLFLQGEFAAAIDAYGGRAGVYLDAAAWAALGEKRRARTLLEKRTAAYSGMISPLIESLLWIVQDRPEEALALMESGWDQDPEALVYLARHYGYLGVAERAIDVLEEAARRGFICAPETLEGDPWMRALRRSERYAELIGRARQVVEQSRGITRENWRRKGAGVR